MLSHEAKINVPSYCLSSSDNSAKNIHWLPHVGLRMKERLRIKCLGYRIQHLWILLLNISRDSQGKYMLGTMWRTDVFPVLVASKQVKGASLFLYSQSHKSPVYHCSGEERPGQNLSNVNRKKEFSLNRLIYISGNMARQCSWPWLIHSKKPS